MSKGNSRPNPYVGPRSFQKGEKLYGRDREIRELLDLLIAERIVVLYSPSGAGKSSLVQAGLVPELEREDFHVSPVLRVNHEPPAQLCDLEGFNRYIYSVLVSLNDALPPEAQAPKEVLACTNLADYLAQRPRLEGQPEAEVILFDQFEEVLTLDPTNLQAKADFFTQLGAALRDRMRWALFAIREDYVAALDPYVRPVPTRFANTFRLDLLGPADAKKAIRQPPSDSLGVDFSEEAAQRLVDDLRRARVQHPDGSVDYQLGPHVEPVQLQVVCFRLWGNLPDEAMKIGMEHIEAIGSVDTALADYYAERAAAAAQETGVQERLIRQWIEQHLITEQGIRGQVLMGAQKSGDLDNQAIRFLENAHLVRAEKRGGATWFELTHDRLIDPIRRDNAAWLATHLSLLQRQAALWENQGRKDGLLLHDQALEEAEEWAAANPNEMTPEEVEFLEASREARAHQEEARAFAERAVQLEAAQKVAEAERLRAEQESQAADRQRQLNRVISTVLVVAVVLAFLAAFFGWRSQANANLANTNLGAAKAANTQSAESLVTAKAANTQSAESLLAEQYAAATADSARVVAETASANAITEKFFADTQRQRAQQQAGLALSRELASLSKDYLGQERDLAFLLGVAAYRASDTLQARSALLTALQQELNRTLVPHGSFPPPPQKSPVLNVAASPDGKFIAWGGEDGSIVLWDVEKQEIVWRAPIQTIHFGPVNALAFSPNGRILATASDDNYTNLLDASTGARLTRPFYAQNAVSSVSFNEDGSQIAMAAGPQIQIWDTNSGERLALLTGRGGNLNSIAWSPDGRWIASAGDNSRVWLWDTEAIQTAVEGSASRPVRLDSGSEASIELPPSHGDSAESVAWAGDSQTLASAGRDKRIVLWDISKRQSSGRLAEGLPAVARSLAFWQDTILASGSEDGTLTLWDVPARKALITDKPHTATITGLAFNRQGIPLIASGSLDKTVGLHEVNIQDNPLSTPVGNVNGRVMSIAVPEAQELLVSTGEQEQASLYALELPEDGEPAPLDSQADISLTALSPEGAYWALASANGEIEVRQLDTGQVVGEFQAEDIASLALSSGGRFLAAGVCGEAVQPEEICSQNLVKLWEIAGGRQIDLPASEHSDLILSLAFSGDQFLASGSADRTITLWDVAAATAIRRFPARHPAGGVTSLAFAPGSNLLASGSDDASLILWEWAPERSDLRPIGEPMVGSSDPVTALVFTPDSLELISGSDNGGLIRWEVSPGSWVEQACRLAGHDLTQEEWEQFIPGQAFTLVCGQEQPATATPVPPASSSPTPTLMP